jgi:hypothetical protein
LTRVDSLHSKGSYDLLPARILAILATTVALAVFANTLVVLYVCYTPVPWNDMWDFWGWSFKYEHNHLLHLAAQHNEHRLAFPRLFFLLDEFVFSGTAKSLAILIPAFQACHAAAIFFLDKKEASLSASSRWFLTAITFAAMFAPQQFANFTWYFQIQFVAVYCCATLALLLLSKASEQNSRVSTEPRSKAANWWVVAAIVAAICTTYSMANGLLIWPLLVSLAFSLSYTLRVKILLVIFGIASWIAYFSGYTRPPDHASPLEALSHLGQFVRFLLSILGSPFADTISGLTHNSNYGQPGAVFFGCIAITGILFLLVSLWRVSLARRSSVEKVYFHLLAFSFCSIALIAAARFKFPVQEALTSRYTTPALLFWTFLIHLLVIQASSLKSPVIRWVQLSLEGAVVLTIASFLVYCPPAKVAYARGYQQYLSEVEAALSNNVFDPKIYQHLAYWDMPGLLSRSKTMSERGLSVFHQPWHRWLGDPINAHYRVLAAASCKGFFDGIQTVSGGDSSGYRLNGWEWDDHTSLGRKFVLFTDEKNRLIGSGFAGYPREDVATALKNPEAIRSGWIGYAHGTSYESISAYLLVSGSDVCPIGSHKVTR